MWWVTFDIYCETYTQSWHCCHGCCDKLCTHCVEKTFQLGAMFRKVFGSNQCVILLIQCNVCLSVSVTQYSFRFSPVTLCNSILQVCANETVLPCTSFGFQSVARSHSLHIQMHMQIGLWDGDFSATMRTDTRDSERCIYFPRLVDDVTWKYVLSLWYSRTNYFHHILVLLGWH